jgi:uncharacterized protein (TIGR03067 family)
LLLAFAGSALTLAQGGDAPKLDGTYEVLVMQKKGDNAPDKVRQALRFTFSGKTLTFTEGSEKSTKMAYRVDFSKTPATINVERQREDETQTLLGILEVKEDRVRILFDDAKEPKRPTGFNQKDAYSYLELKRVAGTDKFVTHYPLKKGNKWTYTFDAAGIEKSLELRVAKMETIDGIVMGRLEGSIDDQPIPLTEHLGETEKGIFRYRMNGQDVEPPLQLLRYPVKAGDKWSGKATVGKETLSYQAVAVEDTVEVPAGKYKAIKMTLKVVSGQEKVTTTYWFAPTVGMVRQTMSSAAVNLDLKLEKFDPAKGAAK